MFDSTRYITEEEIETLQRDFMSCLLKKGIGRALKELRYVSSTGVQLPEKVLRPTCLPELQAALKLLEGRYIIDCLAREGYGFVAHYQDPHPCGSDYYVMVKNPVSSWVIELKGQDDVCLLQQYNNEEIEKYRKRGIDSFKVLAIRLGINVTYFNDFDSNLF